MLEHSKINIKIKLALLWTAATFCYLYGDYFELYTPGKVESLLSGENVLNSPMILFIASALMTIPPLMIALSVLLKPTLSRWLNIIFGTVFTIMMVLIAVGSLTPWYTFYVFLALVEAILTFTIVWTAWKWPKTVTD
jgi:hypothetical protein